MMCPFDLNLNGFSHVREGRTRTWWVLVEKQEAECGHEGLSPEL